MNEEQLYNLSDEELEKQFLGNKTQEEVETETEVEEEIESIEEPVTESMQDEPQDSNIDQSEDIEPTPTEPSYKIKANGIEYDFTLDEMKALVPKALDYTKKTQRLAPYKEIISVIEDNALSKDDLNMLIDLKKGDKNAIASLIKQNNIDLYDIPSDEEVDYRPNNYAKPREVIELQEVIDRLAQDNEYTQTQQIVSELDDKSKEFLFSNPSNLEGIHIDVKNGVYAKVYPTAHKLALMDNFKQPFLDYYIKAGEIYYKQENERMKKEQEHNLLKQQELASKKQAASLPISTPKQSVTDYIDDISDEEFEQMYAKIMSKY